MCFTPEGAPLKTLANSIVSSNWAEREVWELFGVYFTGHPDLRRLLTDTAFKGHPMRRDYPMVGYYECWYTYEVGAIEHCKVEFMQEYRLFEFSIA
jgi:NADH:ubiquinone oxidoreductase subunit C